MNPLYLYGRITNANHWHILKRTSMQGKTPDEGTQHRLKPRASLFFWASILLWGIYAILWTYIANLRLYGFRASVYNTGVTLQVSWSLLYASETLPHLVATFFVDGGAYLTIPMVFVPMWAALAIYSLAIGSSGPITYAIARTFNLGKPVCLAVSAVPLVYFPFAGLSFDDINVEGFFVPLFLLGYLAALRGKPIWGLLFFGICGVLFFPLGGLITLFGVLLTTSTLLQRLQTRSPGKEPGSGASSIRSALSGWLALMASDLAYDIKSKWFGEAVLVLGVVLTVVGYFELVTYGFNVGYLAHSNDTPGGLFYAFGPKLFTVLIIVASLAFIPLMSPRWMLMVMPYLVLMFTINYELYVYPLLVPSWYGFIFLPFVLLALVDGLHRIQQGTTWIHRFHRLWLQGKAPGLNPTMGTRSPRLSTSSSSRILGAKSGSGYSGPAVMCIVLAGCLTVSGWYLLPFGPGNDTTPASFHFPSLLNANRTAYDEYLHLVNLIPRSDPRVIFQNNMPQMLPRPLIPNVPSPLVAGPFNIVAYNLTTPSVFGHWIPISPDYVIGNPLPNWYSFFSSQGTYPFNTSIQQVLYELYASRHYGILGEADGMIVLEHNYTGPLKYYVPDSQSFTPSAFKTPLGTLNGLGCVAPCLINHDLTAHQVSWYGPWTYLSPGTYNVTYDLGLVGWTPSDHITLGVTSNFGMHLLGLTTLYGSANSTQLLRENVTVRVPVYNGADETEFTGVSSSYNGSLILYGVQVQEVNPPPAGFQISNTPSNEASSHTPFNLARRGCSAFALNYPLSTNRMHTQLGSLSEAAYALSDGPRTDLISPVWRELCDSGMCVERHPVEPLKD